MNEATLEAFTDHLRDEGRAETTIRVYRDDVADAFRGDPVAKVRDRALAPKTRRRVQSALRSYAKFAEDGELLVRLGRIRMPPARRVTPKRALERPDWRALRKSIDAYDLDDAVRASLGIVAVRGLRIGDVMRMKRVEVAKALKTSAVGFTAKGEHRLDYTVTTLMRPYLELLMEQPQWDRVCDLVSPRAHRYTRVDSARRRVSRYLSRCAVDAGLDADEVHLHRLRRTYAWHYLRAVDKDLVALQQHMGWLSLETAKEYVDQSRRAELDAAAERMMEEDHD